MNYIINHSTLLTNLVSFWELQESSSTRYDAHGSNHLTANGTGGIGRLAGKVGWGADLEYGDADYLSIADASQTGLDDQTNMSFSYWVKVESDNDSVILGKFSATSGCYWIQLQTGAGHNVYKWMDSTEGDSCTITGSTMTTGTWYHHVWTYAGGTVKFYVDGSYVGTDTTTNTTIPNSSAYFSIGRVEKYASNYFDGVIDQVGVWSKELTSSEVTDLYSSGNGMSYGIAFDATGSGYSGTANSSTMNLTSTGDDRIAIIFTRGGTSAVTPTVDGSTTGVEYISSITLTTGQAIHAYYKLAPPITSVAYAITDTGNYPEIHVITYTGASQTGVPDSYNSKTGDTTPLDLTTNVVASNSWIVSSGRNYTTGVLNASTGTFLRNAGAGNASGDSNDIVATGNQTMEWTNGGSGSTGGIILSFKPVAGAASGPANLKSLDTNLKANIKSYNTNLIANVKSINTNA